MGELIGECVTMKSEKLVVLATFTLRLSLLSPKKMEGSSQGVAKRGASKRLMGASRSWFGWSGE
jgi:hypothetical protein